MINSKDFFLALDLLEKEKKVNKDFYIKTLEAALTSAFKKNFGEARSAEVKLNPEKGTIKVMAYKTIVEEVEDPDKEISLEDAKQLKPGYVVGDIVGEEVTPKNFGRIAAQTAKQVILQRLKEAERSNISAELNNKGDELTTVIIRRKDNGNYYVELAGMEIEGVLSQKDIIPGERFEVGDRVKVHIKRIRDSGSNTEIQVSRTTPNFVRKLFELEVPELKTGDIEIVAITREAGNRTKLAVKSNNTNIDPVGTCVGTRGARINAVMDELHGEKVDIIRFSEDTFEYIANALSPAEVISVEIMEESKSSRVIVPDNKLSLAIGKEGCNVRLAARLTGWKIDVKSESSINNEVEMHNVHEYKPIFEENLDDGDIFDDIHTV